VKAHFVMSNVIVSTSDCLVTCGLHETVKFVSTLFFIIVTCVQSI